jgi:putative transcriptional regulator
VEYGVFIPSTELALKLARALKTRVEDLFQLPD